MYVVSIHGNCPLLKHPYKQIQKDIGEITIHAMREPSILK
jgi:hypothetical protein